MCIGIYTPILYTTLYSSYIIFTLHYIRIRNVCTLHYAVSHIYIYIHIACELLRTCISALNYCGFVFRRVTFNTELQIGVESSTSNYKPNFSNRTLQHLITNRTLQHRITNRTFPQRFASALRRPQDM